MALSIRVSGVAKAFGPVQANGDASLEVEAGEIHALVGENGAGKSTLMRMLAGMFAPDAGTIEVAVDGALRDVTGWSTAEAIAAGVGMVHQHFMLVPPLTVAENVVLGRELTKGWALDRKRAVAEVCALSERTGLTVPAERPVSELSVGEAQRVEILKVLYRGAKILILDEPTAVLSPPEVRELWRVLRGLTAGGGTVVLITHKLDEVVEISDTITVMRAGRTVERIRTKDTTPRDIAKAMVGRDVNLALDHLAAPSERGAESVERGADDASALLGASAMESAPRSTLHAPRSGSGPAALVVRDLVVPSARRPNEVDGVSFDVSPGEIFGIAGVEGNGQTELIEAIAGLAQPASGRVALGGQDVGALGVRERADTGLSHVPEDRHRRGLVLDYTVGDNLILGLQHRFTRGASLDAPRIDDNARRQIAAFDIRPADAALPARALSGGNQQKIVVAREMTGRDYRVLLAAQPTRGVDVGAIEFIHAQLRRARDEGKAIVLVSADLAEILALSDRIAVMYRGRFATVLPRGEASAEILGPYMTGAASERVA
ncbi:ABC transporter related protein [Gemmatirosa kalamazoonensis]|uniref:ABC transporter related protein n=1 Tax=Gemmatirosa kalamazoonensis TaxID=861299 RepID=W0RFI6_9BACT|nr:ABC transporter ATP-binding protein [Gemmatirosa kalamazoonensis]AHG89854.1 ABC transporter related protein [Gemmatirosa kalamazoonensis]